MVKLELEFLAFYLPCEFFKTKITDTLKFPSLNDECNTLMSFPASQSSNRNSLIWYFSHLIFLISTKDIKSVYINGSVKLNVQYILIPLVIRKQDIKLESAFAILFKRYQKYLH